MQGSRDGTASSQGRHRGGLRARSKGTDPAGYGQAVAASEHDYESLIMLPPVKDKRDSTAPFAGAGR